MFRKLLKKAKSFAQKLANNVVDGLIDCVVDYTELLACSVIVVPVLGTGPLIMLAFGSILARTVFSNNGDGNATPYGFGHWRSGNSANC